MRAPGALRAGRGPWACLAGAMLAAAVLAFAWSGDRTFAIDEWRYLVDRSHWTFENLFRPTIGHLTAGGMVLYNLAFSAFGAKSHLPLTLITIGFQCLVGGLVYLYARRRVGAWIALLPAILILFFGAGWEVLLSSATLPNQLGMVCGIGALLALDRRTGRWDAVACLLLAAAIASFSIGLAFAVAAGIRIGLEVRSGDGRRRLWIVGLPLCLYVVWFIWALRYHQGDFAAYNVGAMASGVFDQVNAGIAGVTGLFRVVGRPELGDALLLDTSRTAALVFVVVALVGLRIARGPRLSPAAWSTLGLVAAYVLLVGLGLSDGRWPDASRYAYMFTVLAMLATTDLLDGLRIARAWVYAAAAGLAISLTANVAAMRTGGEFFEQESEYNRAELGALELARGAVDPALVVENTEIGGPLPYRDLTFTAAEYFEATDRFGSPADSPTEIAAAPQYAREAADRVLVRALGVAVEPGAPRPRDDGGAALPDPSLLDASAAADGACLRVEPDGAGPLYASFELPAGGITYASGAVPGSIAVGRFARPPTVALPATSTRGSIRLPAVASPGNWEVLFEMSVPTTFCPLPAG